MAEKLVAGSWTLFNPGRRARRAAGASFWTAPFWTAALRRGARARRTPHAALLVCDIGGLSVGDWARLTAGESGRVGTAQQHPQVTHPQVTHPQVTHPQVAQRRVLGERLAWLALEALEGEVPEGALRRADWQLTRSARGQPGFRHRSGRRVSLSVSHASRWLACAAAHAPVGVDVEALHAVPADFIRPYLSGGEARQLAQLGALAGVQAQGQHACRLWTLKEAYFKTLDAAPGHVPRRWPATLDGQGQVRRLDRRWHVRHTVLPEPEELDGRPRPSSGYPGSGYVLTGCCRAPLPAPRSVPLSELLGPAPR